MTVSAPLPENTNTFELLEKCLMTAKLDHVDFLRSEERCTFLTEQVRQKHWKNIRYSTKQTVI